MRENCARVLAAALMTGAIGTAMGLPTVFQAQHAGRGLTAPPSALERSLQVPQLPADPSPGAGRRSRADALARGRDAGRNDAIRFAPNRSSSAPAYRLRPSGRERSRPVAPKPPPAPAAPAAPATPPAPQPQAPPPPAQPEARELAAAAPPPAAPVEEPQPPTEPDSGKKHRRDRCEDEHEKQRSKVDRKSRDSDEDETGAPPPPEQPPAAPAQPEQPPAKEPDDDDHEDRDRDSWKDRRQDHGAGERDQKRPH